MINNLELIKPLFYFNEANNMFFHCQIVQRAKDHKGEKVNEGPLHTYLVRSKEHLDKLMPEIMLLCEHHGARAYINVAGKDFSTLRDEMARSIVNDVIDGVLRNPMKYLNSTTGKITSRLPKWIVDIDNMDEHEAVKDYLVRELSESDFMGGKVISLYAQIPTRVGMHLITSGFNLQEFHNKFPHINVHKNSMGALLYYPETLNGPKYCCSECGGSNVIVQAWVDANTNEYVCDINNNVKCWCENCEECTNLKEVE